MIDRRDSAICGRSRNCKDGLARKETGMGKLAIVLAGGGSRGAYQIGVWKALRELGIDYQIVTGASVGALNGAIMVQKDFDLALEMWEKLTTPDIVDIDLKPEDVDYQKRHWEAGVWQSFIQKSLEENGVDFAPLEKIMRDVVSEERVRESDVDLGVVTVEYPSMKPLELSKKDIPEGKLIDYLVASAACFPAFKSKQIDDKQYIDGGYRDNLPINLAISMGADEVLAINLDSVGVLKKPKNQSVPVQYISSSWDLGPFLWFEPTLTARNIKLGYLDAMKLYGKMEGGAYTFLPREIRYNAERMAPFADEIFAMARESMGGPDYFQHLARFRLVKAMRRNPKEEITVEEVVTSAMEIAGKLMEVDSTKAYTAKSFNEAILEKFAGVEGIIGDTLEEIRNTKVFVLKDVLDRVQKEGKSHIVSFLYGELKRIMAEGSDMGEFWGLAMMVPTELIAAVYIYGLKRMEDAEKTEE